ncbi:MAG: GldG family protein [Oscillospiraceae bacterium]|nr:GldG family protein [Oscillospiraceae bacterium]
MSKFSFKDIADSFKTRSFRAGGYSIAATAIVLVMVILINLMVGALPSKFTTFDITDNQFHSISEQTKEVLQGVTKDVTVYWVYTEGAYGTAYVESLLDLVQEQSNRIKVVKKDTDLYPNFASTYTADTVYPNSLIVECGEKYSYLNYSGDIYTVDNADYYTTGTYTTYFNGEGALLSAINYVTSDKSSKIYTLTGHEEIALTTRFAAAVKNQNIVTEELSLLTAEEVPQDAEAVLICGPSRDISADELEKLQTYAANGGSIMVITDIYVDKTVNWPNLDTLMADYGMSAAKGFVLDTNSGYYIQNPLTLLPEKVSHAITDPLTESNIHVVCAGAHGIYVQEELPEDLDVTELLRTSAKSYTKNQDMTTYEKESGDAEGPFALAALGTKNAGTENESSVIWVSSLGLVDEDANDAVAGGNMDLFLNMLSYLCSQEEAQLTIHAKPISNNKSLTMSGSTTTVLTVIVMILIPLGYLACGVVIWFRRKRQ